MRNLVILIVIVMLAGCATTSKVAQNVTLGMTTQEVLKSAGKPFSKNAYQDASGNTIEEWSYRETTWDDGGWSWDRTILNTVLTFQNNKLTSFGKTGEAWKTRVPAPNVVVEHRDVR